MDFITAHRFSRPSFFLSITLHSYHLQFNMAKCIQCGLTHTRNGPPCQGSSNRSSKRPSKKPRIEPRHRQNADTAFDSGIYSGPDKSEASGAENEAKEQVSSISSWHVCQPGDLKKRGSLEIDGLTTFLLPYPRAFTSSEIDDFFNRSKPAPYR